MSTLFKSSLWSWLSFSLLPSPRRPRRRRKPGAVKVSWEEFKRLLDLGKDEIVLSWAEFQQIIAQTDTKIVPAFELRDEKVVLTRAQFRNLLEKMKPRTSTGVERPAESLLRRSAYKGRLAGGAVLVLADISADVFPATPGAYVSLPLFPGQIAVRDIRLNDLPALIEIKDGRYTVSTARAGQLRIAVDFALRATGDQVQGITFPVPRTPITTLEFDLPHRGLEVEVPGAQQLEVSERGGGTHVFAVLTPTETVSLRWRKKIAEAPAGPAKVYADTLTLISIEEDAVRINVEIALSVLQNTIPALWLRVPEGYNILDVRGPGVGDWRELTRKEETYLEVPFDFPKKGNFALTVAAEKILPGAAQAAGYEGFTVVDAIREKGFLGVELKGAAEVVVSSVEGADVLDVSELPGALIGRSLKPLIFGFKYLRSPYALVLDIKKHEEVRVISTVIDLASGVTLVTEDGKIVHRVVYSVRNTSKQFLELALPKDCGAVERFCRRRAGQAAPGRRQDHGPAQSVAGGRVGPRRFRRRGHLSPEGGPLRVLRPPVGRVPGAGHHHQPGAVERLSSRRLRLPPFRRVGRERKKRQRPAPDPRPQAPDGEPDRARRPPTGRGGAAGLQGPRPTPGRRDEKRVRRQARPRPVANWPPRPKTSSGSIGASRTSRREQRRWPRECCPSGSRYRRPASSIASPKRWSAASR